MTYNIETGSWETDADFYSFEWKEEFPKTDGLYFYMDGEDVEICMVKMELVWFIGRDYPLEKQEIKDCKWMGPIPLPLKG